MPTSDGVTGTDSKLGLDASVVDMPDGYSAQASVPKEQTADHSVSPTPLASG